MLRFRIFWVQEQGLRKQGSGFRGDGHRVRGAGRKVPGSGFRFRARAAVTSKVHIIEEGTHASAASPKRAAPPYSSHRVLSRSQS